MPLCPSLCVVYWRPTLEGILEFRGINTSISPPIVSMPRLSGVISSSKKSLLLPARISACTAAPSATTSSGFTLSFTGLPKKSPTAFFTAGTLVLPPTITTLSISCTSVSASARALLQLCIVLSINGAIKSSNSFLEIFNDKLFTSASNISLLLRCFFASSAFSRNVCESSLLPDNSLSEIPDSAIHFFTITRSKSSPPR